MCNLDINQEIEDKINTFNQRLSTASASFFNAFEDIKQLMDEDELALFNKHLAVIDERFDKLLMIYRPFIRRYVQANIRTLLAQDKIKAKNHD